jgi:hypothetical protein
MTITPPPPSAIRLKPVSVHHYDTNLNMTLYAGGSTTIDGDAITVGANGILYISVRLITSEGGTELIPYISSPGIPPIGLNSLEVELVNSCQIVDYATETTSEVGYSAMYSGIFVVPAGSVWSFNEKANITTTLKAYDIVYFTM